MKTELLRLDHISKTFSGVKVLNNINLNLFKGEVLGLIGENGAGKTVLAKILSGTYRKDAGSIYFEENLIEINSPLEALKLGISFTQQEVNLIPDLSIAENVFMARDVISKKVIFSQKTACEQAQKLLGMVGLQIDPLTKVKSLSFAQRQLIEIVKALSTNSKLVIMDESTSSLEEKDAATLKGIIRKLAKQGVSIVFISHKLDEVMEIADRITILRDGNTVETLPKEDFATDRLISLMVGRKLKDIYIKSQHKIGNEILRIDDISTKKVLKKISFRLNRGEILGFVGLEGSGRTELMNTLFGIEAKMSGTVYIKGKKVEIKQSKDAIKHKIGMVPEDRRLQGLLLNMAINENISLSVPEKISLKGFVNTRVEKFLSNEFVKKLNITAVSKEQKVLNLSGGNQQKVVIAKWLAIRPEIVIMDEPTRGVDIATKKEIYALIDKLSGEGVAFILVSSDIQEILGMSDRILIMHEGQIRGELMREEATQEKILTMQLNEFSNT